MCRHDYLSPSITLTLTLTPIPHPRCRFLHITSEAAEGHKQVWRGREMGAVGGAASGRRSHACCCRF